ncbi:MAG TPA: hypothetical protein VM327_02355 [Candidatus Thermoplasmatota archaeon]|nr:hypothetical protein [Candidatus Thermoplasmatota archaeon]
MHLRTLALCALLALTVAAPAQAQAGNPAKSTPTTLYFHIFDTFNLFPINTQAPDVAFFKVGGNNFPTIASQGFDFNTIRGFATSGPVEYNFIENGQPRFHPERGIAKDVLIDRAVQPVVHLYLNVRDVVGKHGSPNVLPRFTFVFTMREGNVAGDTKALDASPLIMEGTMTAHVVDGSVCPQDVSVTQLVPSPVPLPDPRVPACGVSANGSLPNGTVAPDGFPVLVADGNGTVDFRFPLKLEQDRIPKADAYNVRVDWFQNPTGQADQDRQFSEGFLRLVSDATHHPRLEMAVLDPVYIEYIHPEVAAGILLIHTCVNSPWGTYDVDVARMTVTVDGPTKPGTMPVVTSQNAHNHGLHDKCAEVTYLWRFREEGAKDGDYAIHLGVPNLAGSALASSDAGFTIEGKKAFGVDQDHNTVAPSGETSGKKSPAAGIGVAVALLGVALLRRRVAA